MQPEPLRRSPRLNPALEHVQRHEPDPQPIQATAPEPSIEIQEPIISEPTLDIDDDSVVVPISSISKDPPISVVMPHLIPQEALQAFLFNASTSNDNTNFSPRCTTDASTPPRRFVFSKSVEVKTPTC
jgi:hypothetical protein